MDVSELEFKVARYKIDTLKITIPSLGETFDVNPDYISRFVIAKEYDTTLYPYFTVTLTAPNRIYRAIRADGQKCKAYIRIQYALFEQSLYDDGETHVSPTNYISENFKVLVEKRTPNLTERAQEEFEIEKDEAGDLENSTVFPILLVKEEPLKLHDKTEEINKILHNVNLMDALTYLLALGGINHDVLCSPPDRLDSYNQFILPPIRLDESILRLLNDYNFHKEGTRVFFDFDTTYILRKNEECTAWRPKEYRVTNIHYFPPLEYTDEMATGLAVQGVYINSKERQFHCTMQQVEIEPQSEIVDQRYGTGYTVVDNTKGTVKKVKSKSATLTGDVKYNRTIVVNSGEAATTNALIERLEEESLNISVAIDDVLIHFLNPNKEFNLLFNSTKFAKYNGKYRLVKFWTTFEKVDGSWYHPTTTATFKGKKVL